MRSSVPDVLLKHSLITIAVALLGACVPGARIPGEPETIVSILEVSPAATVPIGREVTVRGIAARVVLDLQSQGQLGGSAVPHRWSLERQPAPGGITLTVDPAASEDQTQTSARFRPTHPGEYILRLEVTQGDRPGIRAEVTVMAFAIQQVESTEDYWQSIGPPGVPQKDGNVYAGPVFALVVRRERIEDPPTLWAAAVNGGLWRSRDGGKSWKSLAEGQLVRGDQGTESLRALAIDPSDPAVIYAGTSDTYEVPGLGVFRSLDDGGTWEPTGKDETRCHNLAMARRKILRLAVDPFQTSTLHAATDDGLFSSSDRGDCWRKQGRPEIDLTQPSPSPPTLPQHGTVSDLVVHPTARNVLYVAFHGQGIFQRRPALDRTNPRLEWVRLERGLPTKDFGRIALAISASQPRTLYAGYDATGKYRLFRSRDGGVQWEELPSPPQRCDNQCWHNNLLAVHPSSPDMVFLGQVPLFRSLDAGRTWCNVSNVAEAGGCVIVTGPGIHGDNHAIAFDPLDSSTFYLGDDGGVIQGSFNDVGAFTWKPLAQGLTIGQYGSVAIAPSKPEAAAGGVWHNHNSLTRDRGAIWSDFGQGDGDLVAIDAGNPELLYFNANRGFGGHIDRRNADGSSLRIYTARGGTRHWADPFHSGHLLVSDQGVLFRMRDADTTATSPASIDPAARRGDIVAVAFPRPSSALEDPVYYVGTSQGQILRGTPDRTGPEPAWEEVCATGVCGPRSVTGLAADPGNPDRLFATFSGLSPGRLRLCERNATPPSWTCGTIDDSFRPGAPEPSIFKDIAVDPRSADTVYVGTDQGIYRGQREEGSWRWSPSPGMPRTIYIKDLAVHQSLTVADGDVLRAATWGRGIWELVRTARTTPVLVGNGIRACATREPEDSRVRDRLLVVDVNYHREVDREDVRLTATMLQRNTALPFFQSTKPRLTEPSGKATVLVSYMEPHSPLATETDAVRLEMIDEGKVVASAVCPVRKTWKQEGSRTVQVTSQQTGEEGGAVAVPVEIVVRAGGQQYTRISPFEQVASPKTAVVLKAPAEVQTSDGMLHFGGWQIGDKSYWKREVRIGPGGDRAAIAHYRGEPTEPRRELLTLSLTVDPKDVCAPDASHSLELTWSATGGVFPLRVSLRRSGPGGDVEETGDMPNEGQHRFRLSAPAGGLVEIEATVIDAAGFSETRVVEASLRRCP